MNVRLLSEGERTDYYTFQANTLAEALTQMQEEGYRQGDAYHFAACTMKGDIMHGLQTGIVAGQTKQAPSLGWVATAQITSANLRYGFIYRFPKWSNVGGLQAAIRQEWARYTRRLWVHERGHTRHTMPVLNTFLQQFTQLRSDGAGKTAQEAEQAADRELRIEISSIYDVMSYCVQKASDKYDKETLHGRRQGAKLNVRTGRRRGTGKRVGRRG